MDGAPHVSIIIPVYNGERYIRPMLESVMAQKAKRFEVIVVDDGSSDSTQSIVREMARVYGRIRIIEQSNRGPGMARNVGLEHALGEYVLFLDSDDSVEPDLVTHAYTRAKETEADIVVYRYRRNDMSDNSFHPDDDPWKAKDYPTVFSPRDHAENLFDAFKNWPWNKLFRRDFLKDNEIIFPPLHRIEDLLFTCAALASAERIALLDEVLYTYRFNDASSSTQTLDTAPLDFYESSRLLKAYLEYRGLFDIYRRTYVNWVGLCVIVNLFGTKTPRGFIKAYNTLHDGGMRTIGLDPLDAELFEDSTRYELLRIVVEEDLPTGMYRFWHYELEQQQKQHDREIERITSSTTFKVGSKLMSIPTKFKDSRKS